MERALAPVSSVMKGDGQVITKAAVINHQLRGFTQSLDTPEDTLSAADVATGVSCNVRLSNQSLSNRRNELAVHVCVSNRRCNKKGNLAGYATASPSLAAPDVLLTSSLNTQTPLYLCTSKMFKPWAPRSWVRGEERGGFVSEVGIGGFNGGLLGKQTTNRGDSRAKP